MKKLIFWTIFLIITLLSSILSTYFYGYFHDERYWQTITFVQKIEINTMRGLLQLNLDQMIQRNNYSPFHNIFKEYYSKLYINIRVDNNIVFQNRDRTREVGEIKERFEVNNGNRKMIVTINNYKAPSWNDTFLQWLNPINIPKWFFSKLNYITLSFFAFFLFYCQHGLHF
jgi:hypothetical protein